MHASQAFWNRAFASSKVAFVTRSERPIGPLKRYQANPVGTPTSFWYSAHFRHGTWLSVTGSFGAGDQGSAASLPSPSQFACPRLSVLLGALAPPDAPRLVAS